jgi:hypothetical protein
MYSLYTNAIQTPFGIDFTLLADDTAPSVDSTVLKLQHARLPLKMEHSD